MRLICAVVSALLLPACVSQNFQVTTSGPPEVKQPPIPSPFKGETEPALEPADEAGLQRAAELGANVYFYEPEGVWYRYAYKRWYQAFRWNGAWFILDEVPPVLAGVKPVVRPAEKLPTLPEYEEDGEAEEGDRPAPPLDKDGLPTLPEYEDFPLPEPSADEPR